MEFHSGFHDNHVSRTPLILKGTYSVSSDLWTTKYFHLLDRNVHIPPLNTLLAKQMRGHIYYIVHEYRHITV